MSQPRVIKRHGASVLVVRRPVEIARNPSAGLQPYEARDDHTER